MIVCDQCGARLDDEARARQDKQLTVGGVHLGCVVDGIEMAKAEHLCGACSTELRERMFNAYKLWVARRDENLRSPLRPVRSDGRPRA